MNQHFDHQHYTMGAGPLSPHRIFFFIILATSCFLSIGRILENPCDPANLQPAHSLRPDQLTVLINGYSESRIPLLHSLSSMYMNSPSVAAVILLWSNPSTSSQTLTSLSHNLSIPVLLYPSRSLNNRFLPRPEITTRSVLISDDDILPDTKSVEFAFQIWKSHPDRLVGFFARSHEIDLDSRQWIYTVHPHKYSIMLTKFMIMKVEYLYTYSCGGGGAMEEARKVVDEIRNCEDILMNFVAAEEAGAGPVLVGAKKVRDWGDARNEDKQSVREVGLSSRRGKHRKRRGECTREFHRILGRMPLRYSYGKVVDSVGEQGLCLKGGKLVLCDQQV